MSKRNRDSWKRAAALSGVAIPVSVGGVTSDRLYPMRLQEELVHLLPCAGSLFVITSDFGHDGFLIEVDQVGRIIRAALDE